MKKRKTSILTGFLTLAAAAGVSLQSLPLQAMELEHQNRIEYADQAKSARLINIAEQCTIKADEAEAGHPAENMTDGDLSTLWVKNNGGFPAAVEFRLPPTNTKRIKKVSVKFESGHSDWSVDVKLAHVVNSVVEEPITDNIKGSVGFDDGYEFTWQDAVMMSHIQIELSNPLNNGQPAGFWPAIAEVQIWAEDDSEETELVNVAPQAAVSSCSNGGRPENLVDEDYSTLYVFHNGGISTIEGDAWVQASLGKDESVHSIEAAFENMDPDPNGFAFTFDVLGKNKEQSEWNTLFTDQKATRKNGENIVSLQFESPVRLSEVRLVIKSIQSTGGDPWPAVAELKIFADRSAGDADSDPGNIAFKKPVHTALGNSTIERINDGNPASVWSADRYPAYADIDLQANYHLEDVEVYLPESEDARYSVYTSMNGSDYSLAARYDGSGQAGEEKIVHDLSGKEARYVRLYVRLYMEYQQQSAKARVGEVRVHGQESGTPLQSAPAVEIENFNDSRWNTPVTEADTIAEVRGIVERRLGAEYNDWFTFEVAPSVSGHDEFDLRMENGKVRISGNTGVAMAMGLNHYLKYFCNVQISEMVEHIDMPETMPVLEEPVHRQTPMQVRYAYNYCTHSYTMAFFGEKEWRNELDWLALNGVNVVLDVTGQEEVWRRFLMELGYSHQEAKDFVAGPAYSAWFNMANMTGFGGPVHDSHFEKRTELARKNHKIMETLGMKPAVQGYCGMVPVDIAQKDPDVSIINQGLWCSFQRPAMLKTDSASFAKYAEIFYRVQREVFGDDIHYYATDPFHEGGNTGGMSMETISRGVINELTANDPDGIWIIQAWGSNPTPGLIAGLEGKQDHALVLDLYAEKLPRWNDEWNFGGKEFGNTPWVYCMLNNFGGRMGLHGHADNFAAGVSHAYKNSEHMAGIGITPEASQNNPILYDLFFETAWTESEDVEAIDVDAWLEDYVKRAYGAASPAALEALQIMNDTVYNPSLNMNGQGAPESVINARPAESIGAASTWGTSLIAYDKAELERSLGLLLKDYDLLKDSDAYIYDLAALAQQVLSNTAQEYHQKMGIAIRENNAEKFDLFSSRFLDLIDFSETILSTQSANLIGTWINSALAMAEDTDDFTRDLYELNARALVTTWGSLNQANSGGLHDYSNRQWAGLTKDYYKPRWQAWIQEQKKRLAGESYRSFSSDDWFAMEWKWATAHNEYTDQKSNADLKPIAEQLLSEYSVSSIPKEPAEEDKNDISAAELSVTSGSEQAQEGMEGPAINVLDNNTSSLWHSKWSGDAKENLWIDFALENAQTVKGLRYLPRQGAGNGTITAYRIEVSKDGGTTYETAARGSWDASNGWKLAEFDAENVTNVRLYAEQSFSDSGKDFASAAEIRLIGLPKEQEGESVNRTLLEMAVEIAEQTDLTNVHPVIKAHFEKMLDAAKTVLADPAASQAMVDEAWKNLADAMHLLGFTSDKSALEALVKECQDLDLSQYENDEAMDAFKAALEKAKEVLANDLALDATSILPAYNALLAARDNLTPRTETELDTRLLALLVQSVEGIDLTRYMSQGQDAFLQALEQAKNILTAPESQEQIDQAMNTLHQSWLNLRLKADESLLEELLGLFNELNAIDPARIAGSELEEPVRQLKARLQVVVEKSEVSEKEAKALLKDGKELLAAVENLPKTPVSNQVTAGSAQNNSASAKSVKTSAASAAGIFASMGAGALALMAALRRRRK